MFRTIENVLTNLIKIIIFSLLGYVFCVSSVLFIALKKGYKENMHSSLDMKEGCSYKVAKIPVFLSSLIKDMILIIIVVNPF